MTPKARAFPGPAAFRVWLERNHDREAELLIRCFKVHARDRGLTYKQALDEALCWGWIDGVRRGLDDDSFTVRFSPRRPNSIWSAVNVKRARELESEGRLAAPGQAAFAARQSAKGVYSYESKPTDLPPAMKRRFRANARAYAFWCTLPPGYRRTILFWVLSAKQEATQARRLDILIEHASRGERIPLVKPAAVGKAR
jgi:uncharacterized protein YdeI (YjbR/CyaY-like superfamily)